MMKQPILKAKQVYLSSPARPIFRRIGVEPLLQSAFRTTLYHLSDSREHLRIAGVSAEFDATHPDDARLLSREVERPVLEDVLRQMNDDDVLFDVGCHIGTYACLAAAKTSASNVIAFEPSPSNIERLERNLELNGQDIKAFQMALSDSSGQATFVEARDSMQKSEATGQLSVDESDGGEITVDVERGDDVIAREGLPIPNIVKVDVEGAEVGVVRGMHDALSNDDCRLFYCEVHPEDIEGFGDTVDELYDVLGECGFEIERFHEAYGDRYFIRAIK